MKNNFLIFAIGFVLLVAFQAKVIMPAVYDIVASDFFLEDTGDEANRLPTETSMTDRAFEQCNIYISNEILPEQALTFAQKPINAFSLGNYEYVINSDIEILPDNGASYTRKYVCRIRYLEKGDVTGVATPENWSVSGVSGLDLD